MLETTSRKLIMKENIICSNLFMDAEAKWLTYLIPKISIRCSIRFIASAKTIMTSNKPIRPGSR